jgi:hypothetical protein
MSLIYCVLRIPYCLTAVKKKSLPASQKRFHIFSFSFQKITLTYLFPRFTGEQDLAPSSSRCAEEMVAKASQGSVPPPFLISVVKERGANVKRNSIGRKNFFREKKGQK